MESTKHDMELFLALQGLWQNNFITKCFLFPPRFPASILKTEKRIIQTGNRIILFQLQFNLIIFPVPHKKRIIKRSCFGIDNSNTECKREEIDCTMFSSGSKWKTGNFVRFNWRYATKLKFHILLHIWKMKKKLVLHFNHDIWFKR